MTGRAFVLYAAVVLAVIAAALFLAGRPSGASTPTTPPPGVEVPEGRPTAARNGDDPRWHPGAAPQTSTGVSTGAAPRPS